MITPEARPSLDAFPRAYHDIMARSLAQAPRKDTQFYHDTENDIHAVYDPDLGFSYANPNGKNILQWAEFIYKQRIPLLAGELHSHYHLLQNIGNAIPPDAGQVFCRYEFQDFCIFPAQNYQAEIGNYRIQRASVEETQKLFAFYEKSETMKAKSLESLQYTIEKNRLFYLKKTGKIVSAVLTHCENDQAALIGGVYTPQKYRGKGYAKKCMEVLMQSLVEEGKTPCLFYEKNNTPAKALYQKLGFQPHGEWVVIEMIYPESDR